MVRRARRQVTRRMMAATSEGGDGVGVFEGGDVEALAGEGGEQAEEDGDGGPDVGAEVDGVGGEGSLRCSLAMRRRLRERVKSTAMERSRTTKGQMEKLRARWSW